MRSSGYFRSPIWPSEQFEFETPALDTFEVGSNLPIHGYPIFKGSADHTRKSAGRTRLKLKAGMARDE